MIDIIWDYVDHCFNEESCIPSVHQVWESLDHILTEEQIDEISPTIIRFMSIHDLSKVTVNYIGEEPRRMMKMRECVCGKEIQVGEKAIVEGGFYHCSLDCFKETIKKNVGDYVDLLIENEIAVEKEVV